KPDLILGSKVRDGKSYKELSKIAPTVFTNTTGPNWRANFTLHGGPPGGGGRGARGAPPRDHRVTGRH
ncbi:hypothetical protein JFN87_02530, partial [Streptomyces bomunensis]|nr:hypothetical protein [Streptomyces montanisoli]